MFAGRPIKFDDFIQFSSEYKELSGYYNDKLNGSFTSVTSKIKQGLTLWLLTKLIEVKTFTNPTLAYILITAHEANEKSEKEKSYGWSWLPLPNFSNEVPEELLINIGNFVKLKRNQFIESKATDLPKELKVSKGSFSKDSTLSNLIVALYAKMKQVQQAESTAKKEDAPAATTESKPAP